MPFDATIFFKWTQLNSRRSRPTAFALTSRKPGREMITQAYSRMGAAGAAIDDKSPIAPLLQAAMQLRLGDQT